MSPSGSSSLTKRNASSALMPPPPAPKRIKRPSIVLEEETYSSAVSHIIRRDFFPGLAESDAQLEYLNAVESEDRVWIREAGNNLTRVMTPAPVGSRKLAQRTRFDKPGGTAKSTPNVWGADTPVSVGESVAEEGLGKLDQVDLNMTLGAFQAKYTSEDQESFNQIMDKQNKANFEKNVWLREGNMYASKQRLAQQKVTDTRAATSESQELALNTRPSQNLDDRPAAPASHRHRAFNHLMFGPEGVEQRGLTRAQEAENASLAPPKQVIYDNTRLPAPAIESTQPPSPTLSAVRDAIAGRPQLNPSEDGYTGSETPRVNGYAFVDAQPPETEEDDPPLDLLERYGVDYSSKTTPFTLNESSARERMHHRMVEEISAKRFNPRSHPNKTPGSGLGIFSSETPRFLSAPTPARLQGCQTPSRKGKGDLTHAGQRLFARVGGSTPTIVESGGFGGTNLGNRWTPTPKARKKA